MQVCSDEPVESAFWVKKPTLICGQGLNLLRPPLRISPLCNHFDPTRVTLDSMNYLEFIELIGRRGRIDNPEDVGRAVQSTLETLAECLPAAQVRQLAEKLPREAAMYLSLPHRHEEFTVHEFFERVSERSKMDKPIATQRAWVVLSVVEQQLSLQEFNDLRAALPKQYERLFEFAV